MGPGSCFMQVTRRIAGGGDKSNPAVWLRKRCSLSCPSPPCTDGRPGTRNGTLHCFPFDNEIASASIALK